VRPGYLPAIATVAAVALIATTRFGDWWHVGFGEQWFEGARAATAARCASCC
jgi:hypothetical protein